MTTSPTSCSISSAGITAPLYSDILSYFITQTQNIFGSDIYLANDSQLYQLLAVVATAQNDSNAATIATYNSFSPTTSQGTGLSNLVKINGITRLVATNSTADVTLVGVSGAIINKGIVADNLGNQYSLVTPILIPLSGTITVLATAINPGAISSPVGSITQIVTPTLGWQSVTNASASVPGDPVETDAQLRIRQSLSTSYPAVANIDAIQASVANIVGVISMRLYENSTSGTDTDGSISGATGLPGHSIAVVTQGGDPVQIANAIATKKAPGCGTFGTTAEPVIVGNTPITINFSQSTQEVINATILITPKTGYNVNIGQNLVNSFVAYVNGLIIGQGYEFAEAFAAVVGPTYKLESISVSVNGGSPVINTDISGVWNGNYTTNNSNITLVL